MLVCVDHGAAATAGKNLLQNDSLTSAVDDMHTGYTFTAGLTTQVYQLQHFILPLLRIHLEKTIRLLHTEVCCNSFGGHRYSLRKCIILYVDSHVPGDVEQFLRLQDAGQHTGQFVRGDIVGFSTAAPADIGEDRDQSFLQSLTHQFDVDLFHRTGVLVIDSFDHPQAPGSNPVADDGAGVVLRQQGHQAVGDVKGRHFDERDRLRSGNPHAPHALPGDAVALQHIVDPLFGPGNQKYLNALPV